MRKEYVYFIEDEDHIKIGRSYDPRKRLFQIRLEKTKDIKIVKTIETNSIEDSIRIEKYFHEVFDEYRVQGEWFEKNIALTKFLRGEK